MSKPIPAIVEKAIDVDLIAEQVIVGIADLSSIEKRVSRLKGQLDDALSTAKLRRLEIGQMLLKVRGAWPQSGPKAKGWGEFLTKVRLDDSTAWRYMDEAKASTRHGEDSSQPESVRENSGPTLSLVPDPPPVEVEVDRDTWCTPKWITDAIGKFDLDPCANERSHVQAASAIRLDMGGDGLGAASTYEASTRVFVNPPYSDVMPWIAAYAHTRFLFLLKFDPSTKWFAELLKHTRLILIPRGTRVAFEPPPGVPPDKAVANQFPHALFYAHDEDATPEIRALCWAWRVEHDPTNAV